MCSSQPCTQSVADRQGLGTGQDWRGSFWVGATRAGAERIVDWSAVPTQCFDGFGTTTLGAAAAGIVTRGWLGCRGCDVV